MKPLTELKKRRIDLGLTQEEFADKLLDVTRARMLSEWIQASHKKLS